MIYVGVDPGKKGGYALIIAEEEKIDNGVYVYPWDDNEFPAKMRGIKHLADNPVMVACVEKVGAMHGQGVRSMFTFGQSYGFILGVLAALGIGVQLVPPGMWKKEFSLIGKDKAASIEVCKRLFPGVNLLPTDKCRKDSDGMAEALLLACYAKRHF